MTGAEIVAEARTWLGTRYQHQARLKGVGVDCDGLIIGVARELGIVTPDFDVQGYARQPDGQTLLAYCRQFMTEIPVSDLQPGDVPVLCHPRSRGRTAGHMGIAGDYLHGGLSLIHSSGHGNQGVVEHRLDEGTRARIVAAFRMPGVA